MATVRARDSCVVASAPLASMLRTFVDDWGRDRPPRSGGRFTKGEQDRTLEPVGALHWLAAETAAQSPPGVSHSTLERVAAGQSRPTTELRIADAIVTALGRPEVFYDGTLEIQQNPLVSTAHASCCGGSLNGALSPQG